MKNLRKARTAPLTGIIAFAAVIGFLATGCATPPVNPETNPEIGVEMIGEVFSLDPDNPDAPQPVAAITVKHPVAIKNWTIQVQPVRRQGQPDRQPGGQPGGQAAGERPAGERPAGQQRQSRGPFFELTGEGTPPKEWKWNGKSSRPPRASGEVEMVQSATDYQLALTVVDIFDNTAAYEGTISTDVMVRREDDDHYRIIVPSIIFPANSSNFSLLGEADMRANARVLRLIANALNKFPAYKVLVEGHSNPTTPPGPQRTNEETRELKPLSEARAKAVVDYLAGERNIERARLSFVGIGGERTVAPYDDAEENERNRRVEFILQK